MACKSPSKIWTWDLSDSILWIWDISVLGHSATTAGFKSFYTVPKNRWLNFLNQKYFSGKENCTSFEGVTKWIQSLDYFTQLDSKLASHEMAYPLELIFRIIL